MSDQPNTGEYVRPEQRKRLDDLIHRKVREGHDHQWWIVLGYHADEVLDAVAATDQEVDRG